MTTAPRKCTRPYAFGVDSGLGITDSPAFGTARKGLFSGSSRTDRCRCRESSRCVPVAAIAPRGGFADGVRADICLLGRKRGGGGKPDTARSRVARPWRAQRAPPREPRGTVGEQSKTRRPSNVASAMCRRGQGAACQAHDHCSARARKTRNVVE